MVRLLVLLLTLPSLLMPPGMCLCRVLPELVGLPATQEAVVTPSDSVQTAACRDGCRVGSATPSSEASTAASQLTCPHDQPTPAPDQKEQPCAFTTLVKHTTPTTDAVSSLLHFASLVFVYVLAPELPTSPITHVYADPALTPSQPAYISFCTLLI